MQLDFGTLLIATFLCLVVWWCIRPEVDRQKKNRKVQLAFVQENNVIQMRSAPKMDTLPAAEPYKETKASLAEFRARSKSPKHREKMRRARERKARKLIARDKPLPKLQMLPYALKVETGRDFIISYCDVAGELTDRRITIQSVEAPNGFEKPLYVSAYCHLRNELREFRTDRILQMAHTVTGEIVDEPLDVISLLCDFASATRQQRASFSQTELIELWPGLAALVWIAHPGKHFDEEQEDAVLAYINSEEKGQGRELPLWDEILIRRCLGTFRPIRPQVEMPLRRMDDAGRSKVSDHALDVALANTQLSASAIQRYVDLFKI
jgi:hypothetical protein